MDDPHAFMWETPSNPYKPPETKRAASFSRDILDRFQHWTNPEVYRKAVTEADFGGERLTEEDALELRALARKEWEDGGAVSSGHMRDLITKFLAQKYPDKTSAEREAMADAFMRSSPDAQKALFASAMGKDTDIHEIDKSKPLSLSARDAVRSDDKRAAEDASKRSKDANAKWRELAVEPLRPPTGFDEWDALSDDEKNLFLRGDVSLHDRERIQHAQRENLNVLPGGVLWALVTEASKEKDPEKRKGFQQRIDAVLKAVNWDEEGLAASLLEGHKIPLDSQFSTWRAVRENANCWPDPPFRGKSRCR
jgi:hypothetical protein